jgi:mono/diheme cytochrome c family protein
MRNGIGLNSAVIALCAVMLADSNNLQAQAAPARTDSLDGQTYEGWQQYRLLCDRCHGEEARGTTFGPDLLPAFKAGGVAASADAFKSFITAGRPDKGMPPAAQLGLAPEHFEGLYKYLHGRSSGQYHGGRPVRGKS